MSEALVGVIIGGVITLMSSYLNNIREEKRITKTFELENKKLLKEEKLERLYLLLIPIIRIYAKNDQDREYLHQTSAFSFIGNGLNSKYIREIKGIIEKNTKNVSVDLIESFSKAESGYQYEIENDYHIEINIMKSEQETVIDFVFDRDKAFISKVKEEAEEIEKTYF